MITVAILINGNPIAARNAVNQGREDSKGRTAYLTDSGEIIYHYVEDGAVVLAHALLDLIKNDKPSKRKKPKGTLRK